MTSQEEVPVVDVSERFDKMIELKQTLINTIKEEIQELKHLKKEHELLMKKKNKKKRVVDPNNPTGFAKPLELSDEMYSFLSQYGVTKGQLVSRTDVSKYIYQYIKENDLQNKDNKKEFVPDTKLEGILGKNDGEVYNYLGVQKYTSKHFKKN